MENIIKYKYNVTVVMNIKVLKLNNIRISLTRMNKILYLWRSKHESSCNNGVKVGLS